MLEGVKTHFLLYLLALVAGATCAVNKNWNTLYSFDDGKIYVHLKNNDLVALNFSITGFDETGQADVTEEQLNIQDGQTVDILTAPPANTSLVLVQNQLYGFNGLADDNNESDGCGEGVLNLIKYDSDANRWDTVTGISYSGVADAGFYQHSMYLSTPDASTVYIYGGVCGANDEVSNRMISFDASTLEFSNITTATKPQSFYGAANLLAPNPQTQLVIGGQSNNGWLNMYQLATWDFTSGWSFRQISNGDDSTDVNSRRFPLALPVFEPLKNSSKEEFANYYNVNEVLLVGGELLDTDSTPLFAKLSTDTNSWTWSEVDTGLNYDEILGGATIFNTFVVINSTDTVNKRDTSDDYTVSLYDVESFARVDSVKENTPIQDSKDSSKSDVTKKAVLGTVLPVLAIAMAATTAIFIKRKRSQSSKDDGNDIDYQFGSYYDQESAFSHRARTKPNALNNDTNSTLDAASIDSWVKKRQQFEEKRSKPLRNSYLASNDTLSSNSSQLTKSLTNDEDEERDTTEMRPIASPLQTNLVNRSVSRLKKSLSMTSAPSTPTLGRNFSSLKKKKSTSTMNYRPDSATPLPENDVHILKSASTTDLNNPRELINDEDSQSDASVDDNMDVQVLVSSKRRSILRIANPDLETISDEIEDKVSNDAVSELNDASNDAEIRQRIPSGEKKLEED